jgi:hypothetical protein
MLDIGVSSALRASDTPISNIIDSFRLITITYRNLKLSMRFSYIEFAFPCRDPYMVPELRALRFFVLESIVYINACNSFWEGEGGSMPSQTFHEVFLSQVTHRVRVSLS